MEVEIYSLKNDKTLTEIKQFPLATAILLSRIPNLTSLPDLPETLDHLSIYSIPLKTLPKLPQSLKRLHIEGTAITELPELPSSLEFLWIAMNPYLRSPIKLNNGLKSFSCFKNPFELFLEIPDSLTNFHIEKCPIQSLQRIPQNLYRLELKNTKIQSLPDMSHLRELHHINLFGSPVTMLPQIPNSVNVMCLLGCPLLFPSEEYRYKYDGTDPLANYLAQWRPIWAFDRRKHLLEAYYRDW